MPLDFSSLPLREIRKGRDLCWNPHTLDFSKDAASWLSMSDIERELLLSQVFGFLVGERAVTHDLAPLQTALREEGGHMDEEMYLTQQLFEETTHVEFFQRWMNEVLPGKLGEDIAYPRGEKSEVISKILPEAMNALKEDKSPRAQMRAAVVYHQIVEGVLAEVGYQIFYDCLDTRDLLPGLRTGIRHIQVDESRHVAFGTYLAQRLIRDYPELKEVFVEYMAEMLPVTLHNAGVLFDYYGDELPFGLSQERYVKMAEDFHRRRVEAVLTGGLVTV